MRGVDASGRDFRGAVSSQGVMYRLAMSFFDREAVCMACIALGDRIRDLTVGMPDMITCAVRFITQIRAALS